MSTKSKSHAMLQNPNVLVVKPGATIAKNDQQPQETLPEKKEQEKTPVAEAKKQEKEIVQLLNPTAEQRILNARNFQLLSEKYERLKAKQDELNAFSLTSDGAKEQFRLSNSAGVSFEFTNTDVINDVTEVVSKHLEARMEATRKQILEFTI